MHPNPAYRTLPRDAHIAFARDRAFGILAVNAPDGPLMSHIPFVLEPDGAALELHLVRSNPILRLLDRSVEAVVAVSGGDSYVSPDWYGVIDQVPTWNYVAVHLRGTLERLPQDDLRGVLDRLSVHMETRLAPKAPWTVDKMTPDVRDRMMHQIVPCRMRVTRIDGTWKLGQNKPDEVRIRASKAMAADGIGADVPALAALMQDPPEA